MSEKPSGAYVILLLLLTTCVFGPLSSYTGAYVAMKIWSWYLPAYGTGPGLRQWFGILLLAELPLYGLMVRVQPSKADEPSLTRAIDRTALLMLLFLMALFSAWIIHRATL